MRDRTLDQQCTVTRPGLSGISSSIVVELLVSLLHHPEGYLLLLILPSFIPPFSCHFLFQHVVYFRAHAPADSESPLFSSTPSPLGLVPHQLRGFISHFSTLILSASAFDKCVACSDRVIIEYKKKGFEFLQMVCDSPTFLEDLTGLTELKKTTFEDIEWEDDEDEEVAGKGDEGEAKKEKKKSEESEDDF
jgi:ubiquitin-like modifier-activating enzyme ATG7